MNFNMRIIKLTGYFSTGQTGLVGALQGVSLYSKVSVCFKWYLYTLFVIERHLGVLTWEERSAQSVRPSSWTVTDFTPDKITFFAISTPSPRMPAMRTLAVPIRCIPSQPRTYLNRQKQNKTPSQSSACSEAPLGGAQGYSQLSGVEAFIDSINSWHVDALGCLSSVGRKTTDRSAHRRPAATPDWLGRKCFGYTKCGDSFISFTFVFLTISRLLEASCASFGH